MQEQDDVYVHINIAGDHIKEYMYIYMYSKVNYRD